MSQKARIGQFTAEQDTSASSTTIWRLWTDPASWGQWDRGLKRAEANQPLALGATGAITPLSGPAARFEVTGWTEGDGYRFTTRLPLAALVVDRAFVTKEPVRFVHTVWFEGPLARMWSALLGRRFRAELPPTVAGLARLAEAIERP
jgi:hypothetical protein